MKVYFCKVNFSETAVSQQLSVRTSIIIEIYPSVLEPRYVDRGTGRHDLEEYYLL
jgi:hypothetical protein